MIKNSLLITFLWGIYSSFVWSDNHTKVTYEGTLVNLACIIDEDIPIDVELSPITDKQLYLYQRSVAKEFSLVLRNCDPVLANSIKITLNGATGNVTPDGYLSFDASSLAKGAMLGIASDQATQNRIPMGTSLPKYQVEKGTMHIPLYVYVQAKSDSINNKTITPGPFSATMYYQVEFE